MPTAADKDRLKKGIKARQDAIKALITTHQAEFDEMVMRNRVALGLPRRPQGPSAAQLEKKIERAQAQMARWQEELELTKAS